MIWDLNCGVRRDKVRIWCFCDRGFSKDVGGAFLNQPLFNKNQGKFFKTKTPFKNKNQGTRPDNRDQDFSLCQDLFSLLITPIKNFLLKFFIFSVDFLCTRDQGTRPKIKKKPQPLTLYQSRKISTSIKHLHSHSFSITPL